MDLFGVRTTGADQALLPRAPASTTYLRVHPSRADAFATAKRELSPLLLTDRAAYVESKAPLVWDIVREADEWAQLTGWQPGRSDA